MSRWICARCSMDFTDKDKCLRHLASHIEETKHLDDNKPGIQWILAMSGLDDVAAVGDYGAKKYTQGNWRHGAEYMRLFGSASRHLIKVIRGQWLDICETGCLIPCKVHSNLPHLAHVIFNCLILLEWQKTGKGTDDRPIIIA